MIISDLSLRRRLVALGATALVLLALAGCGGSSPPHRTTPAINAAADGRIAREAQLKLSDLPSGWQQLDSGQANSEAGCEGIDAARAAVSARQKSPDFASGNGNTKAQGFVYMYADVSRATHAYAQLSSQSTRRCVADALGRALAAQKHAGATVGTITSGQVAMSPIGDERAEGRFTIPISASGLTISIYVDLVFVRTGRAVAGLTLESVLIPFDETLRDRLTTTVVDRLKAGLGHAA